jgi:Na+/melibiose symporter-like transporter
LIIIINFGINPVNGGTPANESIKIAMANTNTVLFLNKLWRVLIVFELIVLIIRKIGRTIIEYMMKYIIQNVYLLMASIDVIHPICPIDE